MSALISILGLVQLPERPTCKTVQRPFDSCSRLVNCERHIVVNAPTLGEGTSLERCREGMSKRVPTTA